MYDYNGTAHVLVVSTFEMSDFVKSRYKYFNFIIVRQVIYNSDLPLSVSFPDPWHHWTITIQLSKQLVAETAFP